MWQQPVSRFGLSGFGEAKTVQEQGRSITTTESTGALGLRSLTRSEGTIRSESALSGLSRGGISDALREAEALREAGESVSDALREPLSSSSSLRARARTEVVSRSDGTEAGNVVTFKAVERIRTSTMAVDEIVQAEKSDPLLTAGLAQIEMCRTITTGVVEGIAQFGLLEDKHDKVMEAITNVTVEPPDLSPILLAIAKLGAQERQVIPQPEPPDLAPILAAIARVSVEPAALDLRPVEKMMEDIRSEIRRSSEELWRDFASSREELRQDVASLRLETAEVRKEARGDAEVLASELRALPQVLTGMQMQLRGLDQKVDQTELLRAVNLLKPESDPRVVAEAVHDRLSKATLKVDNSEVLLALRRMEPDHQAVSAALVERLKKTTLRVDQSEVLQQMGRLLEQSAQAITTTVHEDMREARLRVDTSEVLDAIGRLDQRLDYSPIVEEIRSANVDLTPIHDAIKGIKLIVDHTPVLDAIRSIEMPDYEAISAAVHARIRTHTFSVDDTAILRAINTKEVDLSSIRDAINKIDVIIDHSPVLEAIRQVPNAETLSMTVHDELRKHSVTMDQYMTRTDVIFSSFHEAINNMHVTIDHSPVLEAIKQVHDAETIAMTVHDKITRHPFSLDQSEVLQAINSLAGLFGPLEDVMLRDLDFTPILEAIRRVNIPSQDLIADAVHERFTFNPIFQALEVHNASVLDAVRRIDYSPVLDAITRLDVPDAQTIASAVNDRMRAQTFNVDHGEVLQAIRNKLDPDLTPILTAISAVSASMDFSSLHSAISKIDTDNTPVLEAIERISVPDSQVLASIILEKLMRQMTLDRTELLDEMRRLTVEPNASLVLAAISATQDDLRAIHEAIARVHRALDFTPVLEAVRRINIPDVQVLATAVQEKMRRTIVDTDLSEVMTEIRRINVAGPDLSQLVTAINSAEVDMSPVIDSIGTLHVIVSTMRTEMKTLLKEQRVVEKEITREICVPTVVETMAPQVPQVMQPPQQPMLFEQLQVMQGRPPSARYPSPSPRLGFTQSMPLRQVSMSTQIVAPRSVDIVQSRPTALAQPLMFQPPMELIPSQTLIRVPSSEIFQRRPTEIEVQQLQQQRLGLASSQSASTLSPVLPPSNFSPGTSVGCVEFGQVVEERETIVTSSMIGPPLSPNIRVG